MSNPTKGVLYAAAAFTAWGLLPLYWKLLTRFTALEITAHRVFWSAVALMSISTFRGQIPEIRSIFRDPKSRMITLGTSILISTNWLVFIWAVNNDRVLDASFGYFINPIISVILGAIFLRERLTRIQTIAVCITFIAVVSFAISFRILPWLPLFLASTFGFYGLLRKMFPRTALTALTAESLILAPFGLIVIFMQGNTLGVFLPSHLDFYSVALLVGAGIVTAAPLLWFSAGAKQIRLSTIGFLQYIGPSISMGLAIFIFDESFTTMHVFTFALIWTALVLYSLDSYLRRPSKTEVTNLSST